ncbi:hypothetical protein [Phascolarctobacterium faecium]|jgi:hypothetical protein|uniref:hypothetical protein n=1 Tax=Phascolarctobacterium faecium TaxID=33025 RepID=UPI003AB57307
MKTSSCIRPRSPYESEIIGQIKHTLSNEFKLSNERQREILQFMIDDIDREEKVSLEVIELLEKDIFVYKTMLVLAAGLCIYCLFFR